MSKIHEALKRAQLERDLGLPPVTNNGPHSVSTVPLAAREQDHHSVLSETVPSTKLEQTAVAPFDQHRSAVPRSHQRGDLRHPQRYEDLIKGCTRQIWSPDPNALVFSPSHAPLLGAEQFRTLRSRLYSIRETSSLKKILVTSAIPGEGKTFVASNIAQTFSQEKDRRVLLIDGDLRKPRLHIPFGAPLSPGLSDYLQKELEETNIIQHGPKGNLCFIPAGDETAHASELLSNGKTQKLLERLEPLFDWIIIDSPPYLPVADARILAGLCDGVLLIVRARYTPSAMAQKARKELQKRNVIGVVLNDVEKAGFCESYHSYGYGHKISGQGER